MLSYPIEVQVREVGQAGGTRGVTANLSARGAYFKTFAWQHFDMGTKVGVKVLVPHPMQSGEDVIELNMETEGRVRRLDRVRGREALGEDGLDLKGIAVEFETPLSFDYRWT
jgi:hypothetical protein